MVLDPLSAGSTLPSIQEAGHPGALSDESRHLHLRSLAKQPMPGQWFLQRQCHGGCQWSCPAPLESSKARPELSQQGRGIAAAFLCDSSTLEDATPASHCGEED